MTENKLYTYSQLNNCQYSVDYTTFKEIYGEENMFHSRICEVNNKKQAQKVVDLLNKQNNAINELTVIIRDLISELHTLRYELDIAIENGFVLEEDISSKKTRYDRFWEEKIKNMEVRQQILKALDHMPYPKYSFDNYRDVKKELERSNFNCADWLHYEKLGDDVE